MLDDRKDVTPKTKFYAIFIATFILYADGVSIDSLGVFWGMELSLGYFTMFALAGFTNALNLIDGLDGLAGSIALVILSAFLYIGYQYDDDSLYDYDGGDHGFFTVQLVSCENFYG